MFPMPGDGTARAPSGAPPPAPPMPATRPQSLARGPAIGNTKKLALADDKATLKYFEQCKREGFADRWVFERQWTRDIHYLNMRQWLAPYSRTEGWRDARITKGVPRPCTSKPKEVDQSIRSMFNSIRFGVIIKPQNQSSQSIITATTADDLMPLLHDVHDMDTVMNEFDFWFVNTGNGFLHTYWDESAEFGTIDIWYETCLKCGNEFRADVIANNRQKCPNCNASAWTPTIDPATQEPVSEPRPKGAAVTSALSPLELAFPLNRPRWAAVPFVIHMQWKTKHEFEDDPALVDYVPQIQWQRSSSERSLQIFQALALQNDIPASRTASMGGTGSAEEEGTAVYTLWTRPSAEHPEGRVIRVAQDNNPIVLHLEDEQGLPGELPYKDGKGNPLFTFTHAGYHHVGGRVIASGAHEPVIQKYDQLNRIDSMIEMIAMRMAAPQWMVPKGVGAAWLGQSPGVPGLILEWNAQIAGAAGRPERAPGIPPDEALMSYRKGIIEDVEEATGTYDILRGSKPSGVEAFSAMQLLVESGQRRFSSAFQSRGSAYKSWATWSLELERQFGPEERTVALMSPTRAWAFQAFKKADLRGDVSIVIEDGTYSPKTTLGERAAVEHLNQLQALDIKNDPDQKFAVFQKFGQTQLVPMLNAHVQSAQKKQEDFEQWVAAGAWKSIQPGMDPTTDPTYPLKWFPWYDSAIHRQEFLKWANSTAVQRMLVKDPPIEGLLRAHLALIDVAFMEKQSGVLDPTGEIPPPAGGAADATAAPAPGEPTNGEPQPAGAGRALANSNQNGGAGNAPVSGQPPTAPIARPM